MSLISTLTRLLQILLARCPPSDGFLRRQIRVIAPCSHQRLRLTIHRRPTSRIKTTAARGFPLPATSPDHPSLAVSLAAVTYVSSLLFIVVESSILPCSTPLRLTISYGSIPFPPFCWPPSCLHLPPSYPVLRAFTLLPFSAGIPLPLAVAPPASCSALPSAPASFASSTNSPPSSTPPFLNHHHPRLARLFSLHLHYNRIQLYPPSLRNFDLGEPSAFYDTFPDDADMAGIQFHGDSVFSSLGPAYAHGFGTSWSSAAPGFAFSWGTRAVEMVERSPPTCSLLDVVPITRQI
ncbi:hypothetical protein C8R46DRAFT_1262332 [Mycena filopes]|nr:hypothetical protein C8R46DRAFT_1262332 [Mycena filopes]